MTLMEALRTYKQCDEEGIVVEVSRQAVEEAAEMLEFFFGQMQMYNPDMGGQHSYRFNSGGWPMTHCKGPNREDAVRSAIAEIKRSRKEMNER